MRLFLCRFCIHNSSRRLSVALFANVAFCDTVGLVAVLAVIVVALIKGLPLEIQFYKYHKFGIKISFLFQYFIKNHIISLFIPITAITNIRGKIIFLNYSTFRYKNNHLATQFLYWWLSFHSTHSKAKIN